MPDKGESMAAYFTLTRLGETKPSTFNRVDEELCRFFGVAVDEEKYLWHWYDTVGLGIALEHGPARLLEAFSESPEAVAVIDYLRSHYEWNAWRGH